MTPERDGIRVERGTILVERDRIARVAYGADAARIDPEPANDSRGAPRLRRGDPSEGEPGGRPEPPRVIDAERHLVIPGFVDAHSHFYGVLVPGLIDRLPLDVRFPFLVASLQEWSERETRVASALGALRMLRNGTTTVLENILQGVEATGPAVEALLATGIRAVVGPMIANRPYHEAMPGLLGRLPRHLKAVAGGASPPAKELVETCVELARRWQGAGGRISMCLSPAMPHRCTDELLTLVAEAADRRRLPVHTHLLETRVQAHVARRLYGHTMVEHIRTLGLLRKGFSGAHAVWLSDRDLDLMAEAGAGISHNPLSNLYLGSGIARVPELLRRGVAVGIGSDGPNCGSTTSLIETMKLAAVVHRIGEPERARWVSASDAFRMATLGGASALGLEHEIGSIVPGKKADLVLLRADAPAFVPLNDPVTQLVYGETGASVDVVLVDGQVVVDEGRALMDPTALLEEARELGLRRAESARREFTRLAPVEPFLDETYRALLREHDRA